jgi:hypothetical protein
LRKSPHKPTSGHLFDQNLLSHLKIFLQKRLPQKGYPLLGQTVFGQVFGRGGMSNFQNPTVPPTGGSHLPHAHPGSFEMRRTDPRCRRRAPIHANLARSRVTCRVSVYRTVGVCARAPRGSSSAASALKCTPSSVDEGRQGRRRTRCSANKDPPRMRNPERVTMVYVRGDDHALSVPIRCTTHLEVRSPQLSWRKRTARRQPRHTFHSPNLPKSQLQKTPQS